MIYAKEYIPYVKTEVRAPTDDSIRLWDEMKKKAYDSLINELNVDLIGCKGKAIVYRDILSLNTICEYKFNLNNIKFNGKVNIKEEEVESSKLIKIQLAQHLAAYIAKQLLGEIPHYA